MSAVLSAAITVSRLALLALAATQLWRACAVPRGRLRRRRLAVGVLGLVASLVRL